MLQNITQVAMPHDHASAGPARSTTAADIASPFAAAAAIRLAIAGVGAAVLWLAVAWAAGWW